MKVVEHFASAYAYAAMPARIALERGDWKAAANLDPASGRRLWLGQVPPGRGRKRVRSRHRRGTQRQTPPAPWRSTPGWSSCATWPRSASSPTGPSRSTSRLTWCAGWRSWPRASATRAWSSLKAAAKREDATEKHVVTPGPLVPAREVYAELLLEAKKGSDALTEFEAVLKKEPNRYRALARRQQGGAHGRRGPEGAGLRHAAQGADQGSRRAAGRAEEAGQDGRCQAGSQQQAGRGQGCPCQIGAAGQPRGESSPRGAGSGGRRHSLRGRLATVADCGELLASASGSASGTATTAPASSCKHPPSRSDVRRTRPRRRAAATCA